MAVEKQRVIDRLKALLSATKVNLSNAKIDELSARLCLKPTDDADDAAIDNILNDFDSMFPFKEIASQDDKIRGLESKLPKPTEPPTPTIVDIVPIPTDQSPLDKLVALVTTLSGEIQDLKSGKVTETKQSQAKLAFEKSVKLQSLPAEMQQSWLNRISLDSETSFEDQILGLEKEHDVFAQNVANSIGYAGELSRGRSDVKIDDKEVGNIVDNMINSI